MTLSPKIITGLPSGVKEAGQRVDFKPDKFDLAIVTKGYRAWWSRTAICPCRNNDQTGQADVDCPVCGGTGWFDYLPDIEGGGKDEFGNDVEVSSDGNAISISAIVTSATLDPQVYEKMGEWAFGTVKVTTQSRNPLGFRDKLVLRDAEMTWGQLIEFDGGQIIKVRGGRSNAGLRYPIVSTLLLASVDKSSGSKVVYRDGGDYDVVDGEIVWRGSPPDVSSLFVSYQMHPVFRIIDHVYAFRDTLIAMKAQTKTKAEQHTRLPTHAMAKLDFILDDA